MTWIQLLRLKCEAFSTLNEADEDPGAEERITTTMSSAGCSPPKPTLIAPAALYLTAILECVHAGSFFPGNNHETNELFFSKQGIMRVCMIHFNLYPEHSHLLCRHILSNVARVAARDSSRNHATLHDLFVALCEDQSIYTLFKDMKGDSYIILLCLIIAFYNVSSV